jgi:hypothetical protein
VIAAGDTERARPCVLGRLCGTTNARVTPLPDQVSRGATSSVCARAARRARINLSLGRLAGAASGPRA